jgi:hypothetical protein
VREGMPVTFDECPRVSFKDEVIENFTAMTLSNHLREKLFSFCRKLNHYGDEFLQGFEEVESLFRENESITYKIDDELGTIVVEIQEQQESYQIVTIDFISNKE